MFHPRKDKDYFDKLYAVMDDAERRQLMESLISEIHIFEERKPNGQRLKSIKFKLPIITDKKSLSDTGHRKGFF